MGATANFASTPRSEISEISAANTNRDGSGTIVSGFTADPTKGSRVDRIEIKAVGVTTAGMVRAFRKDGAGAWKFWREYQVTAAVPSASVPSFSFVDDEIGQIMKPGMQIGFATHNAEAFVQHVSGGDF